MKSIENPSDPPRDHCPSWLWWPFLALLLATLPQPLVWALATDKDQPILIEADSADIDERKGVSIYRGNVEVRQGSALLTADQVTILHPKQKARKIIALGKPVHYRQRQDGGKPDVKGEALRAEYLTDGEELILIGDAVIYQGKDNFRSDRITYDRKTGLVKGGASAKGKQRVHVTIENK